MKAFKRFPEYDFLYPEDMKKIILYLENIGTINVEHDVLEKLYQKFSEEHAASWLSTDTILYDGDEELYVLEEFANWLENQEVGL